MKLAEAIGVVAVVFTILGILYTINRDRAESQVATPSLIRYVKDERSGVCFAYQYNVGMVVLDCDRIPPKLLDHQR